MLVLNCAVSVTYSGILDLNDYATKRRIIAVATVWNRTAYFAREFQPDSLSTELEKTHPTSTQNVDRLAPFEANRS